MWISSLHLSLFGSLSANFDTTSIGDNLVEAGTVPSRFRKNHGNVVSTFQEPITWIFLSNKSAEREKSHQVVTRYVVSLFSFESGDKKFPVYDTWWLLMTEYFYCKVYLNLKNIYKQKTYRMPSRIFLHHADFFKEIQRYLTTMHGNQVPVIELSFIDNFSWKKLSLNLTREVAGLHQEEYMYENCRKINIFW